MMRIAIVGAGAMGCLFAARLAESGASVTLIDVDAARLAALDRDGLTIDDDRGVRTIRIEARLAAEVAGPVDLVLLFTKGVHSAAAIRSVAHLAASGAHALTLQNGIGNADAIAGVFAPDHILIGTTDLPADLEGPARVASHGHGRTWIGPFAPGAAAMIPCVLEAFSTAGIEAEAPDQVLVPIWEKIAFNAALNPLATVTGLTVGGMDAEPGRRIAAAIVAEVAATARARGIAVDQGRIEAKVAFALANHRGHKASMLQDRLAGRPTEIETINGAVARAAREAGIAAPVTETLADLVRLIECARNGE